MQTAQAIVLHIVVRLLRFSATVEWQATVHASVLRIVGALRVLLVRLAISARPVYRVHLHVPTEARATTLCLVTVGACVWPVTAGMPVRRNAQDMAVN